MNDGILTADHIIPAFEADAASLWRPEAIFRLMQELAGEHSDRLNCGRETLLEQGIVWMLARASLKMERYPRFHETVRCETWPGPTGRVTFPRYYTFADEKGDPLGCASTSWMLVDLTARRILPPGKANLLFPDTAELIPPMPEPGRFRLACEGEPILTERAPLYGDVDMNGHMNNANYIAWIADLFPLARHQRGRIRELTIHYAAEAVPGERLTLALYEDGPAFEVRGADAGMDMWCLRRRGHGRNEKSGGAAFFIILKTAPRLKCGARTQGMGMWCLRRKVSGHNRKPGPQGPAFCYISIFPVVLGNGSTSRILAMPVRYMTTRSKPRP